MTDRPAPGAAPLDTAGARTLPAAAYVDPARLDHFQTLVEEFLGG